MYDIYYIAYIINLIVKDILKEYLLKSAAEEELSNYTNTLTTAINTSSHIKVKGLTNKIQCIAIIINYTQEAQQLYKKGLKKYKKAGTILATYKKKIPLNNTT